MKKSYLLYAIVLLSCISRIQGMQQNRPELYQIIDPFLQDVHTIDWDNLFGALDKLGGTISVNAYRTHSKGMSLLDIAVRERNVLAAKKLLALYKADPNIPNPLMGTLPLMAAISNNDLPMIQLLLQYGANPRLQDQVDNDSFYYAEHKPGILAILKQY